MTPLVQVIENIDKKVLTKKEKAYELWVSVDVSVDVDVSVCGWGDEGAKRKNPLVWCREINIYITITIFFLSGKTVYQLQQQRPEEKKFFCSNGYIGFKALYECVVYI
ncbi:hypothetical protein PHYBLDRAFT_174232 [Phycomyces blakesleeanus NRRL 1555(-)]|uniref:Uncharacterized protein n=1 Tax=Phycomyces blakesleeanus (strain ATCC 8743b / DSM 1359 / FGSC 10004 / NBRC 33097 / NRRL 1555) TaxID=763407 RepID=A0A162TJ25_PHYB8|nr:hypothetical protein PHYBLDRAFT_174232 [Phycomyces blakesleeanus NRRL 1555(-)]OAD67543.1 hypothetical protein PHYBLDRAFT_174232 [Phycomyces blakesleeanus NRRL 1555(-)]|eukprot:XP_018285583.1 hypothetical protein PHYBLDRAFT_174232 [Phycomyces blakesleeanus NRRL 1555(-)]